MLQIIFEPNIAAKKIIFEPNIATKNRIVVSAPERVADSRRCVAPPSRHKPSRGRRPLNFNLPQRAFLNWHFFLILQKFLCDLEGVKLLFGLFELKKILFQL